MKKSIIMKCTNFIKKSNNLNYILIIITSLLVSIPFLKITLLGTGDTTLHLLRIIGLSNSIEVSKFPYIVSPYFCNNFGYATNLFYPQLVTYVPYLLKIITPTYEQAMYLFTVITIILSGIFMFNFTKQLCNNKWISLISSIIYIVFPYRFECIYERFAIGEFTALIFIPILFQGLYNLIKQDKTKHYLIALGAIGMLLSHTLTAVYALFFCIIFILLNIKDFLKKDVIRLCLIDMFFIVLSVSLFIIPVIEHRCATNYKIFDAEIMRGTGEDIYDNSATFKQLLTDNGSDKTVSFVIGIPIIIFTLLGIYTYNKVSKENKDWYVNFYLLGLISLYMVTKLFPWPIMPKFLTMAQFSWRILVFFAFFIAPVCGINIYTTTKNIKNKRISKIFIIFCIVILGISTVNRLNNFIIEKSINTDKYKTYEKEKLEKKSTSVQQINREYLPMKAENDYISNRKDTVYVLNGTATIENQNKENLNMSFTLKNYQENTILELPYLYYLGYNININIDGKNQNIKYFESDNGFIAISISYDIDTSDVSIDYTGTILEKIAYLISFIGFTTLIIYIVQFKKQKNSFKGEKLQNEER